MVAGMSLSAMKYKPADAEDVGSHSFVAVNSLVLIRKSGILFNLRDRTGIYDEVKSD